MGVTEEEASSIPNSSVNTLAGVFKVYLPHMGPPPATWLRLRIIVPEREHKPCTEFRRLANSIAVPISTSAALNDYRLGRCLSRLVRNPRSRETHFYDFITLAYGA